MSKVARDGHGGRAWTVARRSKSFLGLGIAQGGCCCFCGCFRAAAPQREKHAESVVAHPRPRVKTLRAGTCQRKSKLEAALRVREGLTLRATRARDSTARPLTQHRARARPFACPHRRHLHTRPSLSIPSGGVAPDTRVSVTAQHGVIREPEARGFSRHGVH